MSRIALLNFVPPRDVANYLGFNHGIGSLSAVIRSEGHVPKLFTIASYRDDDTPLREFRPHALFVYLATNQYRLFLYWLNETFRPMGVPVFVGGPHPTCLPEETARLPGVTGVCVGEGEMTASAILGRLGTDEPFDDVPNLCFERGGELFFGPGGAFVRDLDTLPFADRSIFPYEAMLRDRAIRLMGFEMLATRGCIYGCRYCINPRIRKVHGRDCVRRRTVPRVLSEISEIRQRYGYEGVIGFHDDIFTLDPDWLEAFSDRYAREIGLPFWCNAHVAELTEEIVKDLRRGGCFRVHMGIECGNENTRRDLLHKRISNTEILETVRMLKAHHMKIVTTFMIGLPNEEEADLVASVELCRDIAPDWVLLSTFCPYPGTSLYRELVEDGRLDPRFYENLPENSFYSSTLPYDQQCISQERLDYYFGNFRRLAGVPG